MKFIFLSILCLVGTVYAGEGHNHEAAIEPAPHGGILRDSPPYKTELVLNGDEAKIYVYDKDLNLMPNNKLGSEAIGALRFPKEKEHRKVIFKLGDSFYEGKMTGISSVHRYDLHVDMNIDGKSIVGDFGVDNIH